MDQEHLRTLERACVQEQPPRCLAACPIHVDARALCGHAAKGDWNAAWKVLHRTMPLPGLLARLCHAPCQESCLRARAGDGIRIGLLERAVVSQPAPAQRLIPLPAKDSYVAVLGSGLSGLTLAWDLIRKGYGVTIIDPGEQLGQTLVGEHPGLIDRELMDNELAPLLKLGVKTRLGTPLTDSGLLDSLLEEFDALYLGLDSRLTLDAGWGLDIGPDGPVTDPLLRTTSRDRVLAGGDQTSAIWRAAQGRWAATTLDRLLQGVSLTASRQNEGPYETRLHTNLQGVDPLPATEPADPKGYTPEEAVREASRCLKCECMECVKACAYLREYKGYPKTYARQIYNNEAIVKGHHLANKLINSCMLCGQCQVICPNDFSMADLCLGVRQGMVKRGKMPPSAFDFALEDLRFNLGPEFSLFRHAPGLKTSSHLFFPGCQVCASSPDHVEAVYVWLRQNLAPETGLGLGCCGAPALWAGEQERFEAILGGLEQQVRDMGDPVLVLACATCHDVFKRHAPDLKTITLWELMADPASPHPQDTAAQEKTLALHDPCTARHYPALLDSVRTLLANLGQPFEELDLSRELTSCCGYGGLLYSSNPPLARSVARERAAESDLDYVAYCAMCRDNLAGEGKRILHVLDLLFPDSAGSDPAARPRPGFSQRQESKAALRRRLLRTIWNEEPAPMAEHQKLTLVLDPEVEKLLEDRRILLDNVRQVVLHAEQTGLRLEDPENGRFLAYHKPTRVTYWVEYKPEGEGFRVFNAYSHRMTLPGYKEAAS